MINLPGCIVLFPGVVKIFQIQKIQKFDKFHADVSDSITEYFDRDKVVRNDILNNFNNI